MRGPRYPTLEAQTSRKDRSNTPLRPRHWDYRSSAGARKVASPHQEPKNWHLSCNTVYVAAVRPTGSCSQDIREETFGHLMQVEATQSVDGASSYRRLKSL